MSIKKRNFTGETLGTYKLERLLGEGGMGSVYESYQQTVKRRVAIKILPSHLAQTPDYVTRFTREVEIAARLEHPHILPIYDYGVADGISFVVMRLLPGGTLATRMEAGQLTPPEALRVLQQIASAMDYAHENGVVHRDLKPNNILFDNHENAYLADFGIAKALQSSTNLTGTGTVIGTPVFMAPEQWRGDTVDARTDVYAFGVLGYMLMAGRAPFEADTPFALGHMHLNEYPTPVTSLKAELPDVVNTVLDKAMAKDRLHRFGSAGQFAAALDHAVSTGTLPDNFEPVPTPASLRGQTVIITPQSGGDTERTMMAPPPPNRIPGASPPPASVPAAPAPRSSTRRISFMVLLVIALLLGGAAIFLVMNQDGADPDNQIALEATRTADAALITDAPDAVAVLPSLTATVIPDTQTPAPTRTPIPPSATPIPTALEVAAAGEGLGLSAAMPVTENTQWQPVIEMFDDVEMVLVPAGCFKMGSTLSSADLKPRHEICFEQPFWIDRYEVSQAQFDQLGGQAEKVLSGDVLAPDLPRVGITWQEAVAFCNRRGMRLPSEAEWEYAAAGPDALTYPWGHYFLGNRTVYDGSNVPHVQPIGSRSRGVSWVGAHNLSGNAWEWTNSVYLPYPYTTQAEASADILLERTTRGGGWSSVEEQVNNRVRLALPPGRSPLNLGFRCASDYTVSTLDTVQSVFATRSPDTTPTPSEPTTTAADNDLIQVTPSGAIVVYAEPNTSSRFQMVSRITLYVIGYSRDSNWYGVITCGDEAQLGWVRTAQIRLDADQAARLQVVDSETPIVVDPAFCDG